MALSRSARRTSRWLALATAVASAATLAAGPATASAPPASPGAPGVGDPYFPELGNGGFDALHYDLGVSYDPDSGLLEGRTTIKAKATKNLSAFDLDLQKLRVESVKVNGEKAAFTRSGDELTVTPAAHLRKGQRFSVSVAYAGIPEALGGPIIFGSPYGWMKTKDGVFVACEPNAASTWFPSSDHPGDKATYDIRIDAPKGLTGISNGRLVSSHEKGGRSYSHWRETKPMATYLATATIGKFDVRTGTTPGGTPIYVATDPTLPTGNVDVYGITAEATDYWSKVFGKYPFEETGAIVDDMPQAGFSLEVQSKPVYSAVRDETTIVHELAHQWFGDSVSVKNWQNIWLNEGFASYAQWLWDEHKGTRSAHDAFRKQYAAIPADDAFWKIKVGDPQRDTMFSRAVYKRGAMTLQALRERIGDKAFFKLLPAWTAAHRYGNAETSQFIALAEKISGQQLDDLFQTWLYTDTRPALPGK
ncbi:M1 family metallopeptidase [Streptomyces chattanoogensis]|uniref:Aminopeptidase N n=1 Tax=Streptomyces chattanoogensis TaxID=66876 RepID=A0A0N0H4E9_9ACTN|nr:M1 family metallopeptidase [Streptomyces chattanoogensis]KPC67072.1 metallopeptidase [Streptomyces chattanoogensis]